MNPSSSRSVATADQDRRMQTNQLNSPFLRLPAELRNAIYISVFSETVVEILPRPNNPRFYDTFQMRAGLHSLRNDSGPTAGLLHSCRQIRAETHDMFLSTATFDIRGLDPLDLIQYLGVKKAALTTSIVANGDTAYNSRDGGNEVWLQFTQGKLVSLAKVLLVGFPTTANVQTTELGWTLDWITGGRLRANKIKVTLSWTS